MNESQPDQQSKQYQRNAVASEHPSSRRQPLNILNLNALTLQERHEFAATRIVRFCLKFFF